MSKKVKVKYYAIKEGKGIKNKIVRTWEECSKLVLGYNSVYKSFKTEEDALKYLNSVDVKKVKEQTKKGMEHKKKIKETTRLIQARIPKELYNNFIDKCVRMDMDKDIIIKKMIEEWLY